jgi:hypothetical protein
VVNTDRGFLVEVIIDAALHPEWRWLAREFTGWDFEHPEGCRLEVKHAAARQTWPTPNGSAASFDIATRAGYWDNDAGQYISAPGRHAQIYVFAHHPVADDSADHRDPGQWRFYVVATSALPNSKTIGLDKVRRLGEEVGWGDLRDAVDRLRLGRAR